MRLRHRNQMWIGSRVPPAGTVSPPIDPCVANLAVDQIAYWDADSVPNTDDIAARVMTESGAVPSVAGQIGNGWRITGSSGPAMVAPDDAPLRLVATDFTVRFWIQFDDISGPTFNNDILSKRSGLTGWGLHLNGSGYLQFIVGNGSTVLFVNGPVVAPGVRYHVVAVYNLASTALKFFINSVPLTVLINSQLVIASNTSDLSVGRNPLEGASNGFNGMFDELGLWGFSWEQCEVDADWNSGAGRTHPFV